MLMQNPRHSRVSITQFSQLLLMHSVLKLNFSFHGSVIKDKSETTCEDPQNLTEFPIQEAVQGC